MAAMLEANMAENTSQRNEQQAMRAARAVPGKSDDGPSAPASLATTGQQGDAGTKSREWSDDEWPWSAPVVSRRALAASGFPESLDREIRELEATEEMLRQKYPDVLDPMP